MSPSHTPPKVLNNAQPTPSTTQTPANPPSPSQSRRGSQASNNSAESWYTADSNDGAYRPFSLCKPADWDARVHSTRLRGASAAPSCGSRGSDERERDGDGERDRPLSEGERRGRRSNSPSPCQSQRSGFGEGASPSPSPSRDPLPNYHDVVREKSKWPPEVGDMSRGYEVVDGQPWGFRDLGTGVVVREVPRELMYEVQVSFALPFFSVISYFLIPVFG